MLLDVSAAAERLNLSYRQTLSLVHSGKIKARNTSPGTRPRWRISQDAIDAYLVGADNVGTEVAYTPKPSRLFG